MRLSRETWVLITILALGALLRALYLSEIVHNPDFGNPGVDAAYHDYWARSVVTGDWTPPPPYDDPQIQSTPFFRPPGYPYFLALVYAVSGGSYLAARIAQMLLGLLGVFIAYLLGRRWLGGTAGLIFAGLVSIYWNFIYFEGELLEPVLLVPLGLLLVYQLSAWTDKISFRSALLVGVTMGVFALVRPNILLFAPAVLLWTWWVLRRRGDVKPFGTAVLGLALGSVLAVSPATIRNYVVARDFVPISSNGGINLYIGNNPNANGKVAGVFPELGRFETCFDYPQIVRGLEAMEGRTLKHSEVSAHFSREAKTWMGENPSEVLRLTGVRTLLFWGPKEVGHNKEDELERGVSRVLSRIPGNFALALSMAVVGSVLFGLESRRRKDRKPADQRQMEVLVLVLLFILVYFASYLPFFVAGRYRAPVVPFMLMLGAFGIHRIVGFVAERSVARAAIWLAVLAGGYALASLNPAGYEPDKATWHYTRGVDFAFVGKPDRAAAEYREALKLRPKFPHACTNLGLLLLDEGKADEAKPLFEDALSVNAENPWAHFGLGEALRQEGKLDEALAEYSEAARLDPRQFAAHYQMGMILLAQGKASGAQMEFSRALEINPEYPMPYAGLGMIFEGQGKLDEAAAQYEKSLSLRPAPVLHHRLGRIYAQQRKLDEAVEQWRKAVELDPRDAASHYNLGVASEMRKDADGAMDHYRKAVAAQPNHASAHKNLAVLLFVKGDYAGAWSEVKLARKHGAAPHPEFIRALTQKMPEPK